MSCGNNTKTLFRISSYGYHNNHYVHWCLSFLEVLAFRIAAINNKKNPSSASLVVWLLINKPESELSNDSCRKESRQGLVGCFLPGQSERSSGV